MKDTPKWNWNKELNGGDCWFGVIFDGDFDQREMEGNHCIELWGN